MDTTDKALLDAVERAADRITATLSDLIAFPSIVPVDPTKAGPAERECQTYLRDRLAELGFKTDLWDPDGPALYAKHEGRPGAHKGRTFEGRPILAGTLEGKGGGRSLMLTGHIDVVPPGPASHWRTDPFQATVADGRIAGRGSVDMKGGVASMLMAAALVREQGLPLAGDLLFTTVVDEEIGGMGALAMVDRGYRADAGILPEATALAISPVCHGILWGRILIDGIGGHAELLPKAWDDGGPVDAVWLMRQIMDGIDILNRRWANDPRKRHPLMDLPNQVLVTQVKAGEHPSSFAGAAEIIIDAQYLPAEKDEVGLGGAVKREIEAHLRRAVPRRPLSPPPPGTHRVDPRCRLRRGAGRASLHRRHGGRRADEREAAAPLGPGRPQRHGPALRARRHAHDQLRPRRSLAGASAERVPSRSPISSPPRKIMALAIRRWCS